MSDAFKGLIGGAVLGAIAGRYLSIWFMLEPLLFFGDAIALGALLGGIVGFLWGDKMFEWAGELWHFWV